MKSICLCFGVGLVILSANHLFAGSTTHEYEFSAFLPEATGFSCVVNKADSSGAFVTQNNTGSTGSIDMDFGQLKEVQNYGWYAPQGFAYFVCDLKPEGGVGIPSVSFSYADGANPNLANGVPYSAREGLKKKGIATRCKTYKNPSGSNPPTLDSNCAASTFDGVGALAFNASYTYDALNPSWARLYFGLGYVPDPNSPPPSIPLPAGAQAFNGLDHYGLYDGKVIATITW